MSGQRIAVVGAPGTGKTWLARALLEVLAWRGQALASLEDSPRLEASRWPEAPPLNAASLRDCTSTAKGQWVVSDAPPLQMALHRQVLSGVASDHASLEVTALAHRALFDITLVTGMDLPRGAAPSDAASQPGPDPVLDMLLRQALGLAGCPYKVIYGQGQQRLNNALLALGLQSEDLAVQRVREQAQFAINQGRTEWQCLECSDPTCEHKLFTRLMAQRRS